MGDVIKAQNHWSDVGRPQVTMHCSCQTPAWQYLDNIVLLMSAGFVTYACTYLMLWISN